MRSLTVRGVETVPESDSVDPDEIFFLRDSFDLGFYQARTDRHLGWLTPEEQLMLHTSTVCIAGTGGMGGYAAMALVRQGFGTIRIADPEVFDPSNINRQVGATPLTIDKSKALETARYLRTIGTDYRLEVYPQGVCRESLVHFLPRTDLVIDEIEFWNIGSCILLHQEARRLGIPIYNGLTVGWATVIHYFPPDGLTVEEMLGIGLEEALALEQAVLSGTITRAERKELVQQIFNCFIPHLPQYFSGPDADLLQRYILDRLVNEGKASILATNPLSAAGNVASRALIHMLAHKSSTERNCTPLPPAPHYFSFDIARPPAECLVTREWRPA